MSMVKRIVEMHGGSIALLPVESAAEGCDEDTKKGYRLSLRLPMFTEKVPNGSIGGTENYVYESYEQFKSRRKLTRKLSSGLLNGGDVAGSKRGPSSSSAALFPPSRSSYASVASYASLCEDLDHDYGNIVSTVPPRPGGSGPMISNTLKDRRGGVATTTPPARLGDDENIDDDDRSSVSSVSDPRSDLDMISGRLKGRSTVPMLANLEAGRQALDMSETPRVGSTRKFDVDILGPPMKTNRRDSVGSSASSQSRHRGVLRRSFSHNTVDDLQRVPRRVSASVDQLRYILTQGMQYRSTVSLDILLVDACPVSRKLLKRILSGQGHLCEEATDGSLAVSRVSERLREGQRKLLANFSMVGKEYPQDLVRALHSAFNRRNRPPSEASDASRSRGSSPSGTPPAGESPPPESSSMAVSRHSVTTIADYVYDLIVIDASLPIVDGPTTVKRSY